MTVAQNTRTYREKTNLTLEAFGQALAEKLPGYSFTRQAVHNWESGRTSPEFQFLVMCALMYSDWRRDWAQACLAALKPDVFAFSSNHPQPPASA